MTIDRVIEFASGRGDIPKSTFEMAATLLIDTIGVAAGAANLDAARIARDHAFAFHNAVAKDNKAYMIYTTTIQYTASQISDIFKTFF